MRVKNAALAIAGAVCDGPSARVLFGYNAGSSVTGLGGTFARADASTCARYRDSNGIWQVVAANVLRDQHFPTPSVGPTTLLEPTRTNSALGSCSFDVTTYMLQTGTFTLAADTSCIAGQTATLHTGDGVTGNQRRYQQVGTFVNGQTDCVSVFLKPGTATTSVLQIVDSTAGAALADVTVTWSTKSLATSGTPVGYGLIDLGNGWYNLWVSGTGTAAGTGAAGNARRYSLMPVGAIATTATCSVAYGALEANASFPSSPIVTVASAVTRSVDALSFPFAPVPQAMTVYVKGVNLGTSLPPANNRFYQIGGANTAAAMGVHSPSTGKVAGFVVNGGGFVLSADTVTTLAYGDTLETRQTFTSAGLSAISASLNSGAESAAQTADYGSMPTAWANPVIRLNDALAGTAVGCFAFQSVKIDAGFQSLNTLRAL